MELNTDIIEAAKIAVEEKADLQIVSFAALLHDVDEFLLEWNQFSDIK